MSGSHPGSPPARFRSCPRESICWMMAARSAVSPPHNFDLACNEAKCFHIRLLFPDRKRFPNINLPDTRRDLHDQKSPHHRRHRPGRRGVEGTTPMQAGLAVAYADFLARYG